MSYTEVTLTSDELMMCAQVAALRHVEAICAGRSDRYAAASKPGEGLSKHFEGACGELALCKAFGRHWGGTVNSFKSADVGRNVQVRTRARHDWELIVRQDDSDLDFFFLVTGSAPNYRVHGYIRGHDAKRPEWLANHGGHGEAYFVPQSQLNHYQPAAAA